MSKSEISCGIRLYEQRWLRKWFGALERYNRWQSPLRGYIEPIASVPHQTVKRSPWRRDVIYVDVSCKNRPCNFPRFWRLQSKMGWWACGTAVMALNGPSSTALWNVFRITWLLYSRSTRRARVGGLRGSHLSADGNTVPAVEYVFWPRCAIRGGWAADVN